MTGVALLMEAGDDRNRLEQLLTENGVSIAFSCDRLSLATCHRESDEQPRLWLVDLAAAADEAVLDYMVTASPAPLLVLDELPENDTDLPAWQQRLMQKLQAELSGANDSVGQEPERVWVLGASFGGPEAVRAFMAELPGGLPLALVYVQHIDLSFDRLLVNSLERCSAFHALSGRGELHLRAGEVVVVSPEVRPRFMPFGRMIESQRGWEGRYRPCIDEVVRDLVRLYGQRLGLIIFSGIGEDGALAARQVKGGGGLVWSQSFDSCLCDAMPRAAADAGVVSFSGDPRELAINLASLCRQPITETRLQ